MIEGKIQEIEYGASGPINYIVKLDGRERVPDSVPTIEIRDTDGDTLIGATSMTAVIPSVNHGRGYIAYDAQTTDFTAGSTLTGGTSGATAIIETVIDNGSTGTLSLYKITGTFLNNETITDADGGSATANGAAYTCEYTYTLDASSTTTYDDAENYHAKVTYVIDAITRHDWIYFDVVRHPYKPIITSAYIDKVHPDWRQLHPDGESGSWDVACQLGHAELAGRIRKLGNRAAFIVKREQLFHIELAFVESAIASRVSRFKQEERKYWQDLKEAAWSGRGEFVYDVDEDSEVDSDPKVFSSRFTR